MKMKELQSMAEAVLFAAGEPIELSRLAQALELDELLLLLADEPPTELSLAIVSGPSAPSTLRL